MTGFHSRIFHEPHDTSPRNRDLFPLPCFEEVGEIKGGVCHAVRRRIQSRSFVTQRTNLAISSLNSLFYGGGEHYKHWSTGELAELPMNQRESLVSIRQCVKAFGAPPPEARRSGALQALRTVSDGYSDPDPGVGAVCDMVLNQLSLPSGKVAGVDLASSLDEPLRSMVCNFEDWMMVDGDTWASVQDEANAVCTYNDPMLLRDRQYIQFLKHLHKCGILGLAAGCRGRVGAFTVTKKPKIVDGQVIPRQRLILDCRAVNYLFKEPPHTRLGSLAALTELELGGQKDLFVSGADIRDCFYAAKLPPGMEECFCLHRDISRAEAQSIFGGDFGKQKQKILTMGFSWSFYIIQQLHEQASVRALGITPQQLIKDGNPCPSLDEAGVLAMPYCDNVHVLSTDREEADRGKRLVEEELERMGFQLHEHEAANTYFHTLGGVIDGKVGTVSPTRTRAWNCIFAYLLDHVVSCKLVQQLIGHSIVIAVLNRAGMPIFRHLYDFVQSDASPRALNTSEKREVRIFIGLVPLLFGNMRLGWSTTVTCTDASTTGYGICESHLDRADVQQTGRWQERWRYKHLDPEHWQPRKRATGRDVLGDVRTARPFDVPTHIEEIYQVDDDFPEVPHTFMQPDSWHTALMCRWNNTSEHITLKEGRALVLAARRLTRSSRSRGKKHLVFVDNLALAMCSCKGRATNYGMLRIMQQLSALSLAGGFLLRLRWVPSELNPSDGPSRGQIKPGTYQAQVCAGEERQLDISSLERLSQHSSEAYAKENAEMPSFGCHSEQEQGESEGGEAATGHEEHQGIQSFGQSAQLSARSWEVGQEQQDDDPGEKVGHQGHRRTVQQLRSEVSEFLPGARPRASPFGKHRCKFSRLHGRALFRGTAHERRGEDCGELGVSPRQAEGSPGQKQKSPKRVAKGVSTREPHTLAQADSVRNLHDLAVKGKASTCLEVNPRLRHLHETWGKPRSFGKKLGRTGGTSWTPIQVVCSSDQGLRREAPRQSGSVRQQCSSQQPNTKMDWSHSSFPCEDLGFAHCQDVSLQRRGVPQGVHKGCGDDESQGAAPLSVETRGCSRRLEFQGEGLPVGENEGALADGSIGPKIHKGGKNPTAFEPVVQRRHGVLSLVTPEFGESFERHQACSNESRCVNRDVFLSPLVLCKCFPVGLPSQNIFEIKLFDYFCKYHDGRGLGKN